MAAMKGRTVATAFAVAGLVGLGLLTSPAGAGAAPQLPPVTPQELVASVLEAKPGPFDGSVEVHNALGLPALPGLPHAGAGTSTARVWSGGEGRVRLQLPSPGAERTFVSDGTTFWAWDSATREVVTGKAGEQHPRRTGSDPAAAARELIDKLRATSTLSVDGTAEVAGRPVYELVLAPLASERTLLREVRIAVDGEQRMPLRLVVLANGSTEPVLSLGFTDITFGPQDPSLFTFTPPPGATVKPAPQRSAPGTPGPGGDTTTVGDGWDTVYLAKRAAGGPDAGVAPELDKLGTPVSGSWGTGRLITSAVGSIIVTDDGRVAAGAVPEPVLTEALAR
ncbi:MAG: outer membrane lipoprotein carrier protein LolA [Pseudonocardia sp.]|nr:outer membrane lipoprotein carrier protein LolA [Pseudonocardia sp.]